MAGDRETRTEAGEKAAYGARRPWLARSRQLRYLATRALTRGSSPEWDYIHFRPAVESAAELADLSARINWYLPDRDVPIYVDGIRSTVQAEDVPYMDPSLVRDAGWAISRPKGRPLYVYWRLRSARELAGFVPACRRAEIVDADLYLFSDVNGYSRLRDVVVPEPNWAATAVDRMFAQVVPDGTAFVLATGPSAQMVDPTSVTDDIRITCNSAVKDRELIRELRPTVIAFGDAVFHYGPSKYAAAFRRDLLRALDESDAIVVSTTHWAGMLLANVPQVRDRVAVVSSKTDSAWNIPTARDFRVRHTGNVLTNLLLPTAFALAQHVRVAGCDGRQPQENYFWKHNSRTQYGGDLMATAFQAHPAFFRDRDYGDYYEQHCAELEELLTVGERAGKDIVPTTPSWIPALTRRGAPTFDDTVMATS